MTPTRPPMGLMLALLAAVLSGFAVFVNGYAVRAVGDAAVYTTAKNAVAAVVLTVAAIALRRAATPRRAGVTVRRPRGAEWVGLAWVGVFGGGVPFVLFFEGLARASSVQAAFLHKTLIVWVALLAIPLLSERLRWVHWVAIGLLVAGAAGLSGGLLASLGAPELLILAATLLWSVEVVVAKVLLRTLPEGYLAVCRMGIGAVALLGWLAVSGRLALLTSLTSLQIAWVLITGTLLAAYVATWLGALARASAVDVTALLVVAAPVTATFDALARGVTPSGSALAWASLVLVGGGLIAGATWRRSSVVRPERLDRAG